MTLVSTLQIDDATRLDVNAMSLNFLFNLDLSTEFADALGNPGFSRRMEHMGEFYAPTLALACKSVAEQFSGADTREPEVRQHIRQKLLTPDHLRNMTCAKAADTIVDAFQKTVGITYAVSQIPGTALSETLRDAIYDSGAPALGLACDIMADRYAALRP